VRRHRVLVVVLFAAGIVFGLASYVYDVSFRLLPPLVASEVFQPAVTVESASVLLGLFALGVWWADRLPTPQSPHPRVPPAERGGWSPAISRGSRARPRWLVRAVRAGSDASFGIYLAHPLVLQGLLAIAGLTGLLAWMLQLPGRDVLAIGLLVALPLVIAITWPVVWLARRSPLSLPFAGRQAERPALRRPTLVTQQIRILALGLAVAGAVGCLGQIVWQFVSATS